MTVTEQAAEEEVRHYSLSGKDYWQTPQWLIGLLEEHTSIDLDPCAGEETEIGYLNYRFEDGDDGLEQSWFGNVFVNPPFSYKEDWVEKAVQESRTHNVDCVILLTPSSPTVKGWFHGERGVDVGIIDEADYIWFPNGRINFYDPDEGAVKKNATGGSMLSFFGEISDSLIDALEESSAAIEEHDGGVVWEVDR
jgi:phage N-6-adenine-methyltransferase